eukprot:GHVN01032343.1.p1 GENE.GHVN01032343.1~~GHVN01032343.1.p1  ORF type:complete len:860 (-),score=87.78 GHVN01032343.1:953-3424(-)
MAPPKDETTSTANKLLALSSDVHALDHGGQVHKAFFIWSDLAPAVKDDPNLMFAKCQVLPGSTATLFKCRQVEPDDDLVFEAKQKNAYNYNSNIDPMSFNDIGLLPHTNIPCVIDFLRHRFYKGQIYTTADPLLVAINPFKDLGNATQKFIEKYRDCTDIDKLPPHVFATAKVALENVHSVKKPQSIIVSGESGAGKTEAVKQIMRYFACPKTSGKGASESRIQTAVMSANPVLEAFGNAKTIRNNNSSRFGRFMQLQVAEEGGIEYGSVRNFLLEKSRVVTQEGAERSYHIFYQLLKGADAKTKASLKLLDLNSYKFINPKCTEVDGMDDVLEYNDVIASFKGMMLDESQIHSVLSMVSGVMLMGNVEMEGISLDGLHNACQLKSASRQTFTDACSLLFLDPAAVEEALTTKTSVIGGETVKGRFQLEEGEVLKQSLSKAVYDQVFNWIVTFLNKSIEPSHGFKSFIGMLDIFGFEVFKNNSLEQLFINITNELLQKTFVDIVFEKETALYRSEGISSATLKWTSNDEVIQTLCARRTSVLSSLEDQCLAPGGTDENFLALCHNSLKTSTKLQKAKVSQNINFIVVHTIGEIQYSAENFLTKNKDLLRPELVEILQVSSNPVTAELFQGVSTEKGKLAKGQLIGSQFLNQLERLMALINSTEPHFIRCVKPNETKKPTDFVSSKILIQLHSLSILEALQLRNLGYSYRRPFEDFLEQFKYIDLGITNDPSLDKNIASQRLLERAGIPQENWAIGKTMVFMKSEGAKLMTRKQRECLAAWAPVVQVLEAMWMKHLLRTEWNANRPYLVRIQAHVRRCAAITSA